MICANVYIVANLLYYKKTLILELEHYFPISKILIDNSLDPRGESAASANSVFANERLHDLFAKPYT